MRKSTTTPSATILRQYGLSIAITLIIGATLTIAPSANAQKKRSARVNIPIACVDFYTHTNHSWLAANPVSAGNTSVSKLGELVNNAKTQRKSLIDEAMRATGNDNVRRLGDFWASGLDEAALDAKSAEVLKATLAPIDKLRRSRDLPKILAALHKTGLAPLVQINLIADTANPGKSMLAIAPGALPLQDPGFYSNTDPRVRGALSRYQQLLEQYFELNGVVKPQSTTQAQAALQIETQLAAALAADVSGNETDNFGTLDKRYLQVGLKESLSELDAKADRVAILQPRYFAELTRLSTQSKPEAMRAFLQARVMLLLAPDLAKPWREAHQAYFGQYLLGAPTTITRNERMEQLGSNALNILIDSAYQQRYLDAAKLARAQQITGAVKQAFAKTLTDAAWVDAAAKSQALGRLADLDIEIGGPQPAASFDALSFDRSRFIDNRLALARWHEKQILAQRKSASTANTWPVSTSQPLLSYLPEQNRLLISAATLQPPVFPAQADASDYGAFGALFAHELSKSIELGNRGNGLIGLYNGFAIGNKQKVNGTRTFAMNRADLAGLELAWTALNASMQPTAEQKKTFFSAWAILWARNDSASALAETINNSPYAPAIWRVNGPLSQLPAFAESYGCIANQPMRAKSPIVLWR